MHAGLSTVVGFAPDLKSAVHLVDARVLNPQVQRMTTHVHIYLGCTEGINLFIVFIYRDRIRDNAEH